MRQHHVSRVPTSYRVARLNGRRVGLLKNWGSTRSGMASVGSLALAAVATVGVFVGLLSLTATAVVTAGLPDVKELKTAPVALSTFIYDRSGQHLLYVLEDERRELIGLGDVPLVAQQATIAIEDKSFWSNPGIDPQAMVRAALENFQAGEVRQGASTITQQLIRARLLGDERTIERKMKEAILAVQAAGAYSKREILEMYFNQIYYGNQSYGIKAAAKTYFAITDLKRLTLGQAALLAGLPQAPSLFDPVRNPDGAMARRRIVLEAMVEQGYITREQATAAAAEPVKVKPAETPIRFPHFVFRAREQLADFLGSERRAYVGGYKVYTTIDIGLQEIAEKEVRDRVAALRGGNVRNAAMIAMDPRTGHVLAYVGSVDYDAKDDPKVRGDFDVAGLGERQMGSSFKLFVYLTALRLGMTPSTVLWDVSTNFGWYGNREYRPHNAPVNGKSAENGPLTIRQALRESLNVPAVKVTSLVGIDEIIKTVHMLGVPREWDRTRLGLSFGLGAGEMTLREIASGYAVVANMGKRAEPTMLLKVVDSNGKVVKDWSQPETKQLIPHNLAWLMTDILKDNTDPNASWIFGSWTNIGRPAALKTGTQDDIRDVLAIGYVPQLLTAVWMGNADNSAMYGISSAMGPGVLWQKFMRSAVEYLKLEPMWYERPPGIVERTVCVRPGLFGGLGSGLLPGPGCPGWRITEKYIEGTEPKTTDVGFWGGGCVVPRAERPEWTSDIIRWAAAGRNTRLGVGVCGVTPSASPSPSGAPPGSPRPGYTPRATTQPTPTPRR